jgi:hypothetical protein
MLLLHIYVILFYWLTNTLVWFRYKGVFCLLVGFLLLSHYCCTGGALWHLHKFLQYIVIEFCLHHSPLSLLPHSGLVNSSHFSVFIHEQIQSFIVKSCFYYILCLCSSQTSIHLSFHYSRNLERSPPMYILVILSDDILTFFVFLLYFLIFS